MKKVIVIFGPTGIGKSKTAIELAKKLGGEIISCDSMQVYKKMDIGTAKIKPEQMCGIKHHLLDVADPNEEFSVGKYSMLAKEKIIYCVLEKDISMLIKIDKNTKNIVKLYTRHVRNND